MEPYHKIYNPFKRDDEGSIIVGEWTKPEFEYLANCDWQCFEKLDGCCVRVIYNTGELYFRGKTNNASIPTFLYETLTKEFYPKLDLFKEQFPDGVTFYGEGIGAKIQKGGGNYKADGQEFVLFDVKIGPWWLQKDVVGDIANKFGIKHVPRMYVGSLVRAMEYVKLGVPSMWGDFVSEGFVCVPLVQLFDRQNHRIITKIKHKDFKDADLGGVL